MNSSVKRPLSVTDGDNDRQSGHNKRQMLSIDISADSNDSYFSAVDMTADDIGDTSLANVSLPTAVSAADDCDQLDDSFQDWLDLNETADSIAVNGQDLSVSNASDQLATTSLDVMDKRLNAFMDLLNTSKHFSEVMENNLRQRRQQFIQTKPIPTTDDDNGHQFNGLAEDTDHSLVVTRHVLTETQTQKSAQNVSQKLVDSHNHKVIVNGKSLVTDNVIKSFDLDADSDTRSTTSSSIENNGIAVDTRQPYLVSGTVMREYQLEGLEWLRLLADHNMSGILADEMGLGKTIQAIAMIANLIESAHQKDQIVGPFLVVAPLSTLHNWKQEFRRFAPLIPTLVLHGNRKDRAKQLSQIPNVANILFGARESRKCHPVVITSYEVVKRCIYSLMRYNWGYVVVDEGHKLKNMKTQLAKEMRKFKLTNRLILTGTPIHNTLAELWALLNYVSPHIFNDWKIFEDLLATNSSNEQIIQQEVQNKIITSIHQILVPFMLRRTKPEVGLNLPPKKEILVYAPSTPSQQLLYEKAVDLVKKAKYQNESTFIRESRQIGDQKRRKNSIDYKQYYKGFEDWLADIESNKTSFPVYEMDTQIKLPKELVGSRNDNQFVDFGKFNHHNIVMQMRKITNHPFLVQWPYNYSKGQLVVNEDIVRVSGKMRALDELLKQLYARNHRCILFSQMTKMLDIIEEYCYLRKWQFLRFDGSTHLDQRQQFIDDFNHNDKYFLFLVSTRAGGLGINLCGADTAIIYDSDWNPQMDLQAQDRCHRIGQSKPVIVYRFVTAHTVDDKILKTANTKRKLDKMLIQSGQSFRLSTGGAPDDDPKAANERKMTLQELIDILESTDFKAIYDYSANRLESDRLFSDNDLKKMLDRDCGDDGDDNVIEIGSQ